MLRMKTRYRTNIKYRLRRMLDLRDYIQHKNGNQNESAQDKWAKSEICGRICFQEKLIRL